MNTSFTLQCMIGGIRLNINNPGREFHQLIKAKYQRFLSRDIGPADIELNVAFAPLDESLDEIRVTEYQGVYAIHGGEFQAVYSGAQRRAMVTLREEPSVLDSFLRVLYSLGLIQHDGALFHAAGVSYNGEGYMFMGPSGSGKSTTAARSGVAEVLSDELTLIRRSGTSYRIYATPFCGDYMEPVVNQEKVLARVYRLNKELDGLQEHEAVMTMVPSFLENVFFFAPDVASNKFILKFCCDLAQKYNGGSVNILSRPTIGELIYALDSSCIYA